MTYHMTLSEELISDWQKYSIETFGVMLAINYIDIDDSVEEGYSQEALYIGYAVPINEPPLITKADKVVRLVVISYEIDDVMLEYKH